MTLFTLEGLIRAYVRFVMKGIGHPPSVVDHAYRRWLATQLGRDAVGQDLDGWLIDVPQLFSQRAPGATCLSAIKAKLKTRGFGDPAVNGSKGSGAIMRVAPVGILMERPYENGSDIAALTHGHRTAITAAGWFASWIYWLAKGLAVDSAALRAGGPIKGRAPEFDDAIKRAWQLAQAPADQVPAELGEGWVAEEAAAIALWCVMTAREPMEALRLAVNIDGDSDTTGSLVGQVIGTALGASWIPPAMLARLELVPVMEQLARDAIPVLEGHLEIEGERFERFWARYPGW